MQWDKEKVQSALFKISLQSSTTFERKKKKDLNEKRLRFSKTAVLHLNLKYIRVPIHFVKHITSLRKVLESVRLKISLNL